MPVQHVLIPLSLVTAKTHAKLTRNDYAPPAESGMTSQSVDYALYHREKVGVRASAPDLILQGQGTLPE